MNITVPTFAGLGAENAAVLWFTLALVAVEMIYLAF